MPKWYLLRTDDDERQRIGVTLWYILYAIIIIKMERTAYLHLY